MNINQCGIVWDLSEPTAATSSQSIGLYEEKHQNPSFLFKFILMPFSFIAPIISLSPGKCSDFAGIFILQSLFLKVIPEIFVLKGISYMCSAIIFLFGLSYFFVILGYFWTLSKLLQSLSISFQGYKLYLGHTSGWLELPVALEKPSPAPASQHPHEQTPQYRGNIPHSNTCCSFLRKEGRDSGHADPKPLNG